MSKSSSSLRGAVSSHSLQLDHRQGVDAGLDDMQ